MFDFLSMAGNYQQRKVARFEQGDLLIDTARVTDSEKPFETAIQDPRYNANQWIIVETYDTKQEALSGHQRWVKTMTTGNPPDTLTDVSTASIAAMLDFVGGSTDWRPKPKQ